MRVELKQGESCERLVARFKRIVMNGGLFREIEDGRYYRKPCDERRAGKAGKGRLKSLRKRQAER